MSDHALTVIPGRRSTAGHPYDEDMASENESSSSPVGGEQKERRGSLSVLVTEQCMDSALPDASSTALPSTTPDSRHVASGSQVDSPVINSPVAADSTTSEQSGAVAPPPESYTSAASPTARTYAARFAYPSVCICAEHSIALEAVQHLVGAVRDTVALLTTLHTEAAVEHQCTLLGRMLEFDSFLW